MEPALRMQGLLFSELLRQHTCVLSRAEHENLDVEAHTVHVKAVLEFMRTNQSYVSTLFITSVAQ